MIGSSYTRDALLPSMNEPRKLQSRLAISGRNGLRLLPALAVTGCDAGDGLALADHESRRIGSGGHHRIPPLAAFRGRCVSLQLSLQDFPFSFGFASCWLLPRSGYFFERGALDVGGFGRDAARVEFPKGVRFSSSFGARFAISSIAAHHSRDFRSERFREIGIFSLIALLPSEGFF